MGSTTATEHYGAHTATGDRLTCGAIRKAVEIVSR